VGCAQLPASSTRQPDAEPPVPDPIGDHLLAPKEGGARMIDYQPSQFSGVPVA